MLLRLPFSKVSIDRYKRRRYEYAAALLLTFLVLLPKGGIKPGGIPLTNGYAILFFLAGLSLIAYTYTGRLRWIGRNQFICLAATFPFFALSTLKIIGAGFEGMGFTISFFISLFAMPVIFLLLFYHPLQHVSFEFIRSILLKFVYFTAIYGVFLFFFKLYTGSFVEIPLVTVNVGDVGELENKHIDRGGLFKLISTYNNGNLYGVCMLMMLPLVNTFEQRTYRKLFLKFALFLTLSRTVWVGLLLFEMLNFVFLKKKTTGSIIAIAVVVIVVIAAMLIGLSLLGRDITFLADSSLGGRTGQIEAIAESSFLPDMSVKFEVLREMVYFSVIENFGWITLPFFFLYLFTPLALFLFRRIPNARSLTKRTLAMGLVLYYISAFVDGAILYIPVMAIYWLVVVLLLSDLRTKPNRAVTLSDELTSAGR